MSVLVLSGAIVWDRVNDGFWPRHALFTSLVASLIVVAVTAAVLNEVLERRVGGARAGPCSRKYVLFEFVRTARLVRSGLLELAGLVPDGELGDETLAAELRRQPVILALYPTDWSPVCSDQMALYHEELPEFQKFNAAVLGISVDGVWCHLR